MPRPLHLFGVLYLLTLPFARILDVAFFRTHFLTDAGYGLWETALSHPWPAWSAYFTGTWTGRIFLLHYLAGLFILIILVILASWSRRGLKEGD